MSDLVIETKKLTKIYGEQTAVNSVNLHVKPGRIYGLLGRNGAGKTTIMKMILGLTPITSGEVDVFGQNIKGHEKRIYPRIGAIIETPGFYPNLTGTENLEIFAKLRGTPQPNAVKNALEVVGLPYKDKKLFSKYSLGMKQRLGIANAILHDPELLILDEPTNGLDPIGIAEVRNFIKNLSVERGKTILISSHILSEISLLADDIGIIDHGVLLEESSMEELEKKNRKYIQLQVSDIPKASLILERQFHVTDYAVQDEHNLRLYDTALDMAAINKALVVQDVAVISSQICNDTLEDYFKQITGERELLKLIQVEFLKLRRRKFIWLMLLAALFMPLAAVFYFSSVKGTGVGPIMFYKWTAFSYTPWIILPVVLGMLCTMLMYNENQYDMLKQLWIVPVNKMAYFFSKFAVVLVYSICFMLVTATASILTGILSGYIPFDSESVLYLLRKCMEISLLTAFAVLPVLAVAAAQKGYILPVCLTLIYTFLGFILLMVNMYLHPLSSMTAIVMYDIPGVVFDQPLNIPAAFLCIGVWAAASAVLANVALVRRK